MNDVSRLSDEELMAKLRERQSAPAVDPSKMSDEELLARLGKKPPQTSQGEALGRGAISGATMNLGDEAAGLAAASPIPGAGPAGTTLPRFNAVDAIAGGARLLGEKMGLWGNGEAQKAYDETVAAERARNKLAKEENPWTYGVAEFGGGMAVPFGAGVNTVKGMAKVGGGVGAVTGYGSGEGAADSALGAGVGAGVGGGVGAAIPLAIKGVGAAANMTGIPGLVRGATNPARQAEREVMEAFAKDARGPSPRMDAADFQAAQREFQPVVTADMGGESVRNLARTANNLSDEAGATLKSVSQSRYDDQSTRFRDFFDDMYGGPGSLNNTQLTDDLRSAAARVNQVNYGAAHKAAESVDLWDDTLHALTQAPSVYKAMQQVDDVVAERAVRDGYQPIRNPFTRDPDTGYLQWKTLEDGSAVKPNLEYWNAVKIGLDDQITALERAGEYAKARDIKANRDALRTHLDNLVPEYATARAGAAAFFKADDALEAGQKFMSASKDIALTDAAKALKAMTPEERALFERGFVTELMRRTQTRDGVDVVKLFDNQTMRDKIGMVMGDQRAASLESFVRRERIMNYLKNAVQGNSSTAKQLAAAGVLGGAGGAGVGGDPLSISVGSVMGALSNYGRLKIKEKVAREIADILTSTDPARINQIISSSEAPGQIIQGLRTFEKAVTRGSSARGASSASMAVSIPTGEEEPKFASGGFVDTVENEIRKRVMGAAPRPFAMGGQVDKSPNRPDDNIEDATFFGRRANRLPPDMRGALDQAQELLNKGVDRVTTWRKTGASTSKSGDLMGEIPDNEARIIRPGLEALRSGEQTTLGELLHHPKFFDAYPSSFKMAVQPLRGAEDYEKGSYAHFGKLIKLNPRMAPDRMIDTALHEGHHYIADVEGWAPGANKGMFNEPDTFAIDNRIGGLRKTLDAFEYLKGRPAMTLGDALLDLNKIPDWKTIEGSVDPFMLRAMRDGKMSPDQARKMIEEADAERSTILLTQPSAFDQYLGTEGEYLARQPGARIHMNLRGRRENFPFDDSKVTSVLKNSNERIPNNPDPDWETFREALRHAGEIGYADGGVVKAITKLIRPPRTLNIPGHGEVEAQPIGALQQARESYMRSVGKGDVKAPEEFAPFDPEFAARVAKAYDEMKHNPSDKEAMKSYTAMIDETLAQYKALKDAGIEFKFLKDGQADPYARSPSLGYLDLQKNGRLFVFPTDQGFGTISDIKDNPLLQRVGRVGDLDNATANDAFRVVHDAYGHFGPGDPHFRAPGEERAYQRHRQMFSDEAVPAMTSETRGQNSWVNYGPYGALNRTASGADTVYADQKIGLLPSWAWMNPLWKAAGGQINKNPDRPDDMIEEVGALTKVAKSAKKAAPKKETRYASPALISPEDSAARKVLETRAAQMDLPQDKRLQPLGENVIESSRAAYEDTHKMLPQDSVYGSIPRLPEGDDKYPLNARVSPIIQNREEIAQEVARMIDPMRDDTVRFFYHTGPKYEALRAVGNPDPQGFMREFGNNYASTSPRTETRQNLRNSSLLQYLRSQNIPITAEIREGQGNFRGYPMMGMHVDLANDFWSGTANIDKNPKPFIFSRNSQGNLSDVTSDTHDIRSTLAAMNDIRPGSVPLEFIVPKARKRYLSDPTSFNPAFDVEDTLESAARNKVSRQVEYGPMSDVTRRASQLVGVDPAEAQSLKWFAYGDRTGLASGKKTIVDLQNELIDTTAQALGITPLETFKLYSRGKIPLLKDGGPAGALQHVCAR